ncbi:MAG: LysR family transcriptional regulator [Hyphomicrobiales bacterium]|nr:LysR family transcriptional regulator [Hyphomicrobiales bacterium]MCA1999291.1 LysR family transcriptional regulator [Hyphomicrobiales bacterium]
MNLRSVDLNLLVVLDTLLDEAHVSRAAQRLNLSQPAVSSALQRCRHLFADELLDRGRGTMRRTPRGDALRARLKTILAEVHDLIDPPETPLAEIARTIRIVTADHPAAMMAGPLLEALSQTAPLIDIVIKPWHGAAAAVTALANGDADLAISVFPKEMDGIEHCTLLEETYVVAMRRNHPAACAFDLDTWLAWPHIVISGQGDRRTPLDARLDRIGRSRRIGLVVPSFGMVPDLLARTDMIAMLGAHSFAWRSQDALIAFAPPIGVDGFPLQLAWHRRQSDDQAVAHVASTIKRVFVEIGQHTI